LEHSGTFLPKTILITLLRFNIEWLLFKGTWAPFDKWHLKEDYKRLNKRKELIENLQSRIAMLSAFNFLLMPLILLWQILYCFYNYAELVSVRHDWEFYNFESLFWMRINCVVQIMRFELPEGWLRSQHSSVDN
jgi:hypothetical protein